MGQFAENAPNSGFHINSLSRYALTNDPRYAKPSVMLVSMMAPCPPEYIYLYYEMVIDTVIHTIGVSLKQGSDDSKGSRQASAREICQQIRRRPIWRSALAGESGEET